MLTTLNPLAKETDHSHVSLDTLLVTETVGIEVSASSVNM